MSFGFVGTGCIGVGLPLILFMSKVSPVRSSGDAVDGNISNCGICCGSVSGGGGGITGKSGGRRNLVVVVVVNRRCNF